MIRIELTDDDLARTRLALSPLWELVRVALLRSTTSEPPRGVRALGRTHARRALRDVDLGPLDLSIPLRHSIPDFAAPIPKDPLRGLADEIEAVRATEPDVVRADIAEDWRDDPPPPWDAFVRAPARDGRPPRRRAARLLGGGAGRRLAAAARGARGRDARPAPARSRSRAPAAVLEELHPSVRWRHPVIELIKDKECDMHLDGRPLVLIPLVFARGVLMGESEDEQRGGARLPGARHGGAVDREAAGFDGRLELLLGHGRAAVLRALDRPATTTELARRLSYAPSTVSAHLDVLARAGLVERHRVRRSVFYGLNETGRVARGAAGRHPRRARAPDAFRTSANRSPGRAGAARLWACSFTPTSSAQLAATRYETPLPSRCAPARPAQPSYGAKKARTSSSVTRARGLPVAIRPTTRR